MYEVFEGRAVLEGAEQQLQLLVADDLGEFILIVGQGFLIEDGSALLSGQKSRIQV